MRWPLKRSFGIHFFRWKYLKFASTKTSFFSPLVGPLMAHGSKSRDPCPTAGRALNFLAPDPFFPFSTTAVFLFPVKACCAPELIHSFAERKKHLQRIRCDGATTTEPIIVAKSRAVLHRPDSLFGNAKVVIFGFTV